MSQERWWVLYKDAVLETDRDNLSERIRAAEAAIAARLSLDGLVTREEKSSLETSRKALRVLKEEYERREQA